jgi:hypothetical protein
MQASLPRIQRSISGRYELHDAVCAPIGDRQSINQVVLVKTWLGLAIAVAVHGDCELEGVKKVLQ